MAGGHQTRTNSDKDRRNPDDCSYEYGHVLRVSVSPSDRQKIHREICYDPSVVFYEIILTTSAARSTNLGSKLIFASSVVGT